MPIVPVPQPAVPTPPTPNSSVTVQTVRFVLQLGTLDELNTIVAGLYAAGVPGTAQVTLTPKSIAASVTT